MSKALIQRRRHKPAKPHPSFPLTAHNNGQWCKKIRGKVHFFGVWDDAQTALDNYLRAAADLHAGRLPRSTTLSPQGPTVKDVCNHYLTFQLNKAQSGQIVADSFNGCLVIVESFASIVGATRYVSDLAASDFEQFRSYVSSHGLTGKSKGAGICAQSRAIMIVRSIFKYAYESDLIDRPMKYGPGFSKPSATLKRKARNAAEMENGKRLFAVGDVLKILSAAGVQIRAMILLAINGGLGNSDCARLPLRAVDLDGAVIEFGRPKTGIERTIPLWPETVDALRKAIAMRPKASGEHDDKLVFLTHLGHPWVRDNIHSEPNKPIAKVVTVDAVGEEFDKLLIKLSLKRKGLGFYALRHTFRTWADEVRDQHAIHRIMGHTIPGMSGIYVETIGLERLVAVTEHVREKLFGRPGAAATEISGPASVT